MIRSKYFHQKVFSVAIACSSTRSLRCPALHCQNAMLTSRCAWVFSGDVIITQTFSGIHDTPLAHYFCIADRSPNNQQLWQYGFFIVGENQGNCSRMCMVVFFRQNASVAILAAVRKRSFWAAFTVMKNCRYPFAWPCTQLKERDPSGCRAPGLTPEVPVHVTLGFCRCWFRRCFVVRR